MAKEITREELLAKFKDGEERYRNSSMLHQVVESLVRGADPIEIIDQLIIVADSTQKSFEVYAKNHPLTPTVHIVNPSIDTIIDASELLPMPLMEWDEVVKRVTTAHMIPKEYFDFPTTDFCSQYTGTLNEVHATCKVCGKTENQHQ